MYFYYYGYLLLIIKFLDNNIFNNSSEHNLCEIILILCLFIPSIQRNSKNTTLFIFLTPKPHKHIPFHIMLAFLYINMCMLT